MKVAFQGEKGAFSHVISCRLFGDPGLVPCRTFSQVFESVKTEAADTGVIPVENSLTGRINEPTGLLVSSELAVCGEGMLKIVHCLIANEGVGINGLEKIYAHPEALAQCRKFLGGLSCEQISWHDGAAAAEIVKKDRKTALISSEKASEIYGLEVLKRGIQDSSDNTTRFVVISRNKKEPTGSDKTSLVFFTKNKPGALYSALGPFAKENVNLTRLESIPSKERPWEYLFLVDFEGHIDSEGTKKVLKDLKGHTTSIKVLGSYPMGKSYE